MPYIFTLGDAASAIACNPSDTGMSGEATHER